MKAENEAASTGDFSARLAERIIAARLRVRPTGVVVDQYERYYRLLSKWNRRINLTSLPLDGFPAPTLDRLFVEPLIAAEFIEDSPSVYVDVGSGGGSPALPLKIVRPLVAMTMIESRARKAAFLREASRVLGLATVDVLADRVEQLGNRIEPGSVDFVTVRAVKLDSSMLKIISEWLCPSGRLFLFGARGAPEVSPSGVGVGAVVETTPVGFREVRRQHLPSGAGSLVALAKT